MIRRQHSAWLNKGQTWLGTITQGRDKILTGSQKVKGSICLILLDQLGNSENNKQQNLGRVKSKKKKKSNALESSGLMWNFFGWSQVSGKSTASLALKRVKTVSCKGLPNSLVIPQACTETGWML